MTGPVGRVRARALVGLLVLAAAGGKEAACQDAGTVVGLVLGGARTTQVWKPEAPGEGVTGIVLGAFADASTPLSGLTVRAEGTWTRRGGEVVLDVAGLPATGGVRSDYLAIGLHARLSGALGPLRLHVAAGPTLDQLLSSRLDPVLRQALDEEKSTVIAVTVGAGARARVRETLFLEAEVRLTEGLSDAYAGGFTSARHRSLEGVARLAVPLSLVRDR